jgi:hypothetical protein
MRVLVNGVRLFFEAKGREAVLLAPAASLAVATVAAGGGSTTDTAP